MTSKNYLFLELLVGMLVGYNTVLSLRRGYFSPLYWIGMAIFILILSLSFLERLREKKK